MSTKPSKPLSGKRALLAGAGQGIGAAIARSFAAAGASVVANDRSGAAETLAAEIESEGGSASACIGDVTDPDFVERLVENAAERLGGIDILVNCAGVGEPEGRRALEVTPEEWRGLVDVHLNAVFYACRAAAPHLVASRGAILNTSSHSFTGIYGGSGYPAGKGGVNSLSFALAAELREQGVRVNAVCPGAKTRLSSGPAYAARIDDLHARGILDDGMRQVSLAPPAPEELTALYVFLASDRARHITGRLLSASGGYVGIFDPIRETPLAFRSVEKEGAWRFDELAEALSQAPALPKPEAS